MSFNENLTEFLRNLADSVEMEKLVPNQMQCIAEFYTCYNLRTYINEENNKSENYDDNEFTDEDFLKFFILAWYMYIYLRQK